MFISADRLDDLLAKVFTRIRNNGRVVGASRGATKELFGVLLHLKDPLARLSRTETKGTVYSGLGELFWYLAASNALDFIRYYAARYIKDSSDGVTLHGAYGPRLYRMRDGINQIENVQKLLREKPTSRRAVIQLFNAEDLAGDYLEIPCTCTLQFVIRARRLHLMVHMRSNDAFWGLPHDVFAFTMLQEMFARSLNVRLGSYRHAVGSLHLYDDHAESVEAYLNEGWHEKITMPAMPPTDPWPAIATVLRAESALREGRGVDVAALGLSAYWQDIVRLLQVYRHFKNTQDNAVNTKNEFKKIDEIKAEMSSRIYDAYIEKKKTRAKPEQLPSLGQMPFRW